MNKREFINLARLIFKLKPLPKHGMYHSLTGGKEWYNEGFLHRENGPSTSHPNGYEEWHVNGILHRKDGPAIVRYNGITEWYFNGVRHRDNGPAVEMCEDKEWWKYSNFYSEKCKAGKILGNTEWWKHGLLHREDGPAIIDVNGFNKWYLNGNEITEEEFNRYLKNKSLKDTLEVNLSDHKSSRNKYKI